LFIQGVSYCQAITACTIIALLYISRAIYNILAVSPIKVPTFGFGWVNVSDQVCLCFAILLLDIFFVLFQFISKFQNANMKDNKALYRVNHKTFVTVYMLLSINFVLLKKHAK